MKFLPIVISLFAATSLAQNGCGFPDGPDCESVGVGANGLEQFVDPDGCCLLPFRCGNIAGELCERVSGTAADNNGNGNGNNNGNNNGNANANANANGNGFNFGFGRSRVDRRRVSRI
ncbi:hypothetical protein CEP54_010190 [Fusarium duplospermum]|uniref:Uncharacterized protein n=1 Tax=Fusarium duplospermum TaxID=1325734 RepID=A0A428PL76_9HYPO|nr:hypothetical protein CEP54_010190 [Fusarium duplospermum]